jgi:hypothetical protein
MLGEALLEPGAVGVGQGADEGLACIERGAAKRIFGQWVRLGARMRRATRAWRE